MTVKDALEIARLYEATEAGARVMSQSSYDCTASATGLSKTNL